uniref:Uncharacterized protein n=1 Tax=Lactuca sativa TaxID=4236 RepID=A0A9R1WD71_LACSA|nr:hypothetical protein LSAT_V11C200054780 [Lactuca sativa]
MFEGSKNDTSINPRCWVAMNFKQSIPYALLQAFVFSITNPKSNLDPNPSQFPKSPINFRKTQSRVRPMYVGGSNDGYLMKVNQNPGNFLVVIGMN